MIEENKKLKSLLSELVDIDPLELDEKYVQWYCLWCEFNNVTQQHASDCPFVRACNILGLPIERRNR